MSDGDAARPIAVGVAAIEICAADLALGATVRHLRAAATGFAVACVAGRVRAPVRAASIAARARLADRIATGGGSRAATRAVMRAAIAVLGAVFAADQARPRGVAARAVSGTVEAAAVGVDRARSRLRSTQSRNAHRLCPARPKLALALGAAIAGAIARFAREGATGRRLADVARAHVRAAIGRPATGTVVGDTGTGTIEGRGRVNGRVNIDDVVVIVARVVVTAGGQRTDRCHEHQVFPMDRHGISPSSTTHTTSGSTIITQLGEGQRGHVALPLALERRHLVVLEAEHRLERLVAGGVAPAIAVELAVEVHK